MSDFLNDIQCDELVNGQSFDGQYVPTEQDLADMNEACNAVVVKFQVAPGGSLRMDKTRSLCHRNTHAILLFRMIV